MMEIHEKWGFGLAPPKPGTQAERVAAATAVLGIIASHEWLAPSRDVMDSISVVKGMFNRIARQDQWDWFAVSRQLGYPSGAISAVIADQLKELRDGVKFESRVVSQAALTNLRRLPARKCLEVFLGKVGIAEEAGVGWIYILSCREYRDLLKIGQTSRTVEERVKEINAATGVAVPFGVRACYRVKGPMDMESAIHARLSEFRLRADREFFRVDFILATRLIRETLDYHGSEVRTLNALAALA